MCVQIIRGGLYETGNDSGPCSCFSLHNQKTAEMLYQTLVLQTEKGGFHAPTFSIVLLFFWRVMRVGVGIVGSSCWSFFCLLLLSIGNPTSWLLRCHADFGIFLRLVGRIFRACVLLPYVCACLYVFFERVCKRKHMCICTCFLACDWVLIFVF
mgnify:CR=1 FL=1